MQLKLSQNSRKEKSFYSPLLLLFPPFFSGLGFLRNHRFSNLYTHNFSLLWFSYKTLINQLVFGFVLHLRFLSFRLFSFLFISLIFSRATSFFIGPSLFLIIIGRAKVFWEFRYSEDCRCSQSCFFRCSFTAICKNLG